jgi:hypothetical protein
VADEGTAAADRHIGRELLTERRLADARLANNHRERALARECGVEGGLQLL